MQTFRHRTAPVLPESIVRAASCFAIIGVLCMAGQVCAEAQVAKLDAFDRIGPVPKQLRGVDVVAQIGAQLPLDLPFVDEVGNSVVLGDLVTGDLPVVLTFNYSNCPMLCSLQLSSLVTTLQKMSLVPGRQFRIVTVGLDPEETKESVRATKKAYVSRFGDKSAEVAKGWHFIRGTKENVRTLAETVGFGYRYLPERKDYAHSTALILVSAAGVVTSYIKGIHYQPSDLTAAIADAGMNLPGEALGFVLSCFQYDSKENNYSGFATRAMRWGGSVFVAAVLFTVLILVRRHRAHGALAEEFLDR